jgi:hypothetical protein
MAEINGPVVEIRKQCNRANEGAQISERTKSNLAVHFLGSATAKKTVYQTALAGAFSNDFYRARAFRGHNALQLFIREATPCQ